MASVVTSEFQVPDELVTFFARELDGNPVHLPGHSNELLPPNTASGLLVMALASKALLQLPEYKEILCARGFRIKFKKPVFRNQVLFVRAKFEDSPHDSRPGIIFRRNQCEVVSKESDEVLIAYEITQLLRETSRHQ